MLKKIGGKSTPVSPGDMIVCEKKYKKVALSIRRDGRLFFEDTLTTEKIVANSNLLEEVKHICQQNSLNAQLVKDDHFEKCWILRRGGGSGVVSNSVFQGLLVRDIDHKDCSWITGIISAGTKVYLYFGDGGDGDRDGKAKISLKPNLPTVYEIYPSLIDWDS